MIRKGTVFAAMALVLVAAIGTAVVIAQSPDERPPNTEVVDLDQIKEDVVRELFDSAGKMIDPKRQLAKVARDHEGGFGGYYFHETDKSIAYVYMQDLTETTSAEDAFRSAYNGDREITQIIPVQGDYSFDQLVEWYYILDRAFAESDIRTGTGSVRVLENRIRFGLRDAGQIDDALRIIQRLEVPEGAVVLVEDHITLLTDEDSVRAKWRPLVGGIQHEEGWYTGTCTIGFVTERDDVEGLVIASHCTNEDGDIGGLDDANVHQPNDPLFGSNIVAEETIDPELTNLSHSDCLDGWECRYSDAAFAELDSDEDLDRGIRAFPGASLN